MGILDSIRDWNDRRKEDEYERERRKEELRKERTKITKLLNKFTVKQLKDFCLEYIGRSPADELITDEDDEEFDDEEFDDEFAEDFEEPEESTQEAAQRMGYTLNLSGSSPGFVNHQLQSYNSGVDFRATFEFPMLLQMGPFRFRLGAEIGTFKFTNYKPIGGTFSGVHVTGVLSFPAGPGQVRLGGGMIGSGFGVIAENSYGLTLGSGLDVRVGLRSTTAFGIKDSKENDLGTASWMDGILVIGVNL